jgi:WD40 repeat protein
MAGESGVGIYEVSWSPSGDLVASGGMDSQVQIWNSDTGECISTFKGHTNWVHAVDWDKDGNRVLSRSDDGTARIWNCETGECEKVYEEALVPEDFEIGSAKTSTLNLSGLAETGDAVGIQVSYPSYLLFGFLLIARPNESILSNSATRCAFTEIAVVDGPGHQSTSSSFRRALTLKYLLVSSAVQPPVVWLLTVIGK